jgi:hypothetical protein
LRPTGRALQSVRHYAAAIKLSQQPDKDDYVGRAAAHAMAADMAAARKDLSVVIDGPGDGQRFAMDQVEVARHLVGRAFMHVALSDGELAIADVISATEIGGQQQILRLQLLLKRNGLQVSIDGKISEALRSDLRKCFGAIACRADLATDL